MVSKPKGPNSSNPRKDSRAIPNNASTGSDANPGATSAGAGPGARDRGTGPQDVDAQGATNAPPVVRFGGIPFDSPEYNQTPPGLLDGFPTLPDPPPLFDEVTPRRASAASKGKAKAKEPTISADPRQMAEQLVTMANMVLQNSIGPDAVASPIEEGLIVSALADIFTSTDTLARAAKVTNPVLLAAGIGMWSLRIVAVYRQKHPQKPRTTHVTPKPETRASATVTETPDLVEPAISENGMQPEELAGLASVMGI